MRDPAVLNSVKLEFQLLKAFICGREQGNNLRKGQQSFWVAKLPHITVRATSQPSRRNLHQSGNHFGASGSFIYLSLRHPRLCGWASSAMFCVVTTRQPRSLREQKWQTEHMTGCRTLGPLDKRTS